MGDEKLDKQITDTHLQDYEEIVKDEGKSWSEVKDGKIGAILVLDQFSRNMFRKQAKAFKADPIALRIANELIESGEYEKLQFLEKVFSLNLILQSFALLPFEHSEDMKDQETCINFYEKLLESSVDEGQKSYGKG